MNDVGDREGRGDNRYGSDWLVWKSTDTFAPLGPFIVPKEFIADPHKLHIWFDLSGKRMQDASTELMQHSIDELLHFVSNNIILQPGDVIATGTPSGVGIRASASGLHETGRRGGVLGRGHRHPSQPDCHVVRRHASMNAFPTVDVSKTDAVTAREVDRICRETGFLAAVGHGVRKVSIQDAWREQRPSSSTFRSKRR